MADPQKPDPNVFWCKKCRCHGEFVEKEKTVSDSQGSSTEIIQHCIICDAKGGVPCEQKNMAGCLAKFLVAPVLAFAIIMATASIIQKGFTPSLVVGVSSITMMVAAMWSAYGLPYYRWKKWAKERGWEEEKPKAE